MKQAPHEWTVIPVSSLMASQCVKEIQTKGHIYHFNYTIEIDIYFYSDLWIIECKDFNLLSYDADLEKAREEFYNYFDTSWHEYALCPDQKLSEDAKKLKQKLLALVTEIVPEA